MEEHLEKTVETLHCIRKRTLLMEEAKEEKRESDGNQGNTKE